MTFLFDAASLSIFTSYSCGCSDRRMTGRKKLRPQTAAATSVTRCMKRRQQLASPVRRRSRWVIGGRLCSSEWKLWPTTRLQSALGLQHALFHSNLSGSHSDDWEEDFIRFNEQSGDYTVFAGGRQTRGGERRKLRPAADQLRGKWNLGWCLYPSVDWDLCGQLGLRHCRCSPVSGFSLWTEGLLRPKLKVRLAELETTQRCFSFSLQSLIYEMIPV